MTTRRAAARLLAFHLPPIADSHITSWRCGVSQASRSKKKKKKCVISICGFETSVCCYGTCDRQLCLLATCCGRHSGMNHSPGVSELPLPLCRQNRPRLANVTSLPASCLHHNLVPHPPSTLPWTYLMNLCHCLFPWLFATPTVPNSGAVQVIHWYTRQAYLFFTHHCGCYIFKIKYWTPLFNFVRIYWLLSFLKPKLSSYNHQQHLETEQKVTTPPAPNHNQTKVMTGVNLFINLIICYITKLIKFKYRFWSLIISPNFISLLMPNNLNC